MKLISFLVGIVFMAGAFADPDDPRPPEIDSVNPGQQQSGSASRRAVVRRSGHEDLTLDVIIEKKSLACIACLSGIPRRIEMASIREIRFSRWEGVQVKKNLYRYSPGEAILYLDDGTTFCSRLVPELRIFRTTQGKFYSYFFKTHSGGEKNFFLKEPVDGTVYEIRFIDKGNSVPLWPFPRIQGLQP